MHNQQDRAANWITLHCRLICIASRAKPNIFAAYTCAATTTTPPPRLSRVSPTRFDCDWSSVVVSFPPPAVGLAPWSYSLYTVDRDTRSAYVSRQTLTRDNSTHAATTRFPNPRIRNANIFPLCRKLFAFRSSMYFIWYDFEIVLKNRCVCNCNRGVEILTKEARFLLTSCANRNDARREFFVPKLSYFLSF